MKHLRLAFFAISLALHPSLQAGDWKETLNESLPLLGHRNWIVIADSAYPWQTSPGVRTIHTSATQEEVTRAVLQALAATKHVKPTIFIDRELEFVSEKDAPGITAYRNQLVKILAGSAMTKLPHEEIIAKLDEAGKTFHVLLLKTNMTIPYTSVFLQLECGYWDAASEKRLRDSLPKNIKK
jgi:L-fucose mutarotase/ribose pyranase (RbsD/FucU family)